MDDLSRASDIVYTCFCTDVIHDGHRNIINEANKLGRVVVGVLCDEEMLRYNRYIQKNTDERVEMVRGLEGVSEVIVQKSMMYRDVVRSLRPKYVVHGDNWRKGPMAVIREKLLEQLEEYGGELIEVPYTNNTAIQKIDRRMKERMSMPDFRRHQLHRLLKLGIMVKTIEVHSGLTGLIAEKTLVSGSDGVDQFDAMWISSLCDSTEKGKPDIELVDMTSRLRTIDDVMEVTTKPIIFDGDTGGLTEHFVYSVRTLERMGVSAVIIEDKTGLKQNSLFGTEVEQRQDTIDNFCAKLRAGKNAQISEDFMIIARIESLVLDKGVDDALERARAYVAAGADGIMIHSRRKDPAEIFAFCDSYRSEDKKTPIVVVPTAFDAVKEQEFRAHGVNIVIYANQLLRAAYPAMKHVAEGILINHRAMEMDSELMPVKEFITLMEDKDAK